jgi:hypothetical protein
MTDLPRELRLVADASASCDAVYDTLLDVGTHLDWAGRRSHRTIACSRWRLPTAN